MKLHDTIKKLLIEDSELRNSDKMLMWRVWELEGVVSDGKIAYDSFIDSKTTTPESIRKCKQKIQKDTPSLRSRKSWERAVRMEVEIKRGTFMLRDIVTGEITRF